MATKKLFEALLEMSDSGPDIITTRWGEGEEYEAVSRVRMDDDTGQWDGYLVFKDERFSPANEDIRDIQYKYPTPAAANGVLAVQRAGELWKTLSGIFAALGNPQGVAEWDIEYTKWDNENTTVLILQKGNFNGKWGWFLEDLECDGEVNSSARMFDTPGEAAEAGLKYYDAWLKEFKATGSREGPLE